jgi:3'(2'), 5'-bisphosphate nucleotidase
MKDIKQLIEKAITASIEAGKKIMEIYESGNFEIETKSDNSPLTIADKKSQETIMSFIENTDIPVLSEEGKHLPYQERKHWEWLWLVDPLDGTKEFIKRNGEFTVNIALIHNNRTIAGVIYVPVKKELYYSDGEKSYFSILDSAYNIIKRVELPIKQNKKEGKVIVASRSHLNDETKQFIESISKREEVKLVSAGSSLKFCLVAKGEADLYPRYAPTMEWDTAAGHAIVKAAGFNVYDVKNGEELKYNKDDLYNPYFIVK